MLHESVNNSVVEGKIDNKKWDWGINKDIEKGGTKTYIGQ
jgi:hypothetical protein